MTRAHRWIPALLAGLLLAPSHSLAQGLSVAEDPVRCREGEARYLTPDGGVTCLPPPPRPPPPPVATEWNPGDRTRWFVESGIGGLVAGRKDHVIAGAGVSRGVRRVRKYDPSPPVDPRKGLENVFIALFTLCLVCVPVDVWLGNERGFDVRARFLGDRLATDGSWSRHTTLGIAPAFRITKKESRFRFPSVLNVALPEIGASFPAQRPPEVYLRLLPFPIGYLLAPHAALELEPEFLMMIPVDGARAYAWAALQLSVVVR